ncbi:CoA ester lyase [Caenimonas sedimenti]|uniref:CoA ester lyase n=1 Tax=Caenimonas sedimenti TaxID=2596921 RepID=A0A562ZXL3_9BURK|nr:CoA ester lyase [Caenimonas sedimenti]TWO73360.1 CoA ester lyase [Caenimonas sedimenti]
MSSTPSPLAAARSFLFVPADRLDRLPKALASGAHAVILDLEDAVATAQKADARRSLLREWPSLTGEQRARMLLRINAAATDAHEDDHALLRQLAPAPPAAVMLPKAETATAIERVARSAVAPVVPLIESAQGLHALEILARARGVLRIAFGHLDFQAELGMQCSEDERELDPVRLALVLASRRAGLPAPVDGVTVALDDAARLVADTRRSRRCGFRAKLCIHPGQVAIVNEALGPTAGEREWAQRVLAASRVHGTGAFRLDGTMVDAPVLQRANAILHPA